MQMPNDLPPQNIEAEQSVLAGCLLHRSDIDEYAGRLKPNHFYRSAHQKIFSAVIDLFARNEPVDLVTLTNKLREGGHLEGVGGATFLASLVDEVPMAANAQHYARIVHEKACLRRLIEKANEITRQCFEDRGNVEDVLDFAESAIFEISEDR